MSITRRQFIKRSGAAGLILSAPHLLVSAAAKDSSSGSGSIDRRSVVRRHNPTVTRLDPFSAMSVGNGEFAFTSDVTGLQTFTAECAKEFPLCTASHWGWHTTPAAPGLRREDFRYKEYETYGRRVGYATDAKGQEPLFNWLRQNPHKLHLGRIGLELTKADGTAAQPNDLKNISQTLDLWTGLLVSRFEFEGKPVEVQTCCHSDLDLLAVRVESPLLAAGKLRVLIAFPYGSPELSMADWGEPERHSTTLTRPDKNQAAFARRLDGDEYYVRLGWSHKAELTQKAPHEFALGTGSGKALEFVCLFSAKPASATLPGVDQTQAASRKHWQRFWTQGGAIDLGASTDPRAEEIERRVVLSLYQTAIHCAGSLPSAETGLLSNSWYGKFHLEMHWWHSVHFTAWGRFPLFERSLGIYHRILPLARANARRQGYQGARWPKMIGPDGLDSPSPVAPLLIWEQPHPIYYAELCYRERPGKDTLERWRDIVFESAEFMASYAVLDKARDQFVLGPPLKTVSENTPQTTSMNPTFELAYWRFGLRVAQQWRERLGLPRQPRWDEVLAKLAPLPAQDGLYLMQEGMTDTYTKWNWEHPALLGAFGAQPGDGADPGTMRRTVRRVMEVWQWERAWGWDFGMAAMAAARAGEPELAVRALLIDVPKNRYWPNGHNYQRENLAAYLPGNGSLLCATAMMAAGWTGGPAAHAPGFPADGKWSVRHEGLKRWI
jgi:protein-glucosylgalactosylhydroxylysine glucosidase